MDPILIRSSMGRFIIMMIVSYDRTKRKSVLEHEKKNGGLIHYHQINLLLLIQYNLLTSTLIENNWV